MEEILLACATLQHQGKTPSIALLKARVGKQFGMPQLIEGLSQWRNNPQLAQQYLDKVRFLQPANPVQQEQSSAVDINSEATEQPLQQQLDRIEAKLDVLINLLSQNR